MHKTNENHLCCPTLQSIAHFDNQTFAFCGMILNSVYSFLPQSQQHLFIDHPPTLKLKLIYFNFLRRCNTPTWPLGVLQPMFKASSNKVSFDECPPEVRLSPLGPKAAYERPLTPSAPGSILTKGLRAYVIQTGFFFLMYISLKQMFLLLPCDLVINSPKSPVILSCRPSVKTDSSLKCISVFTTIQEGNKLSYRIKVNIYFMRPEVSVT